MLNIIVPMAGRGSRFKDAGYVFPKPLIEVMGKTMIEVVINNLRPKCEHKFIFICQKEHYEQYDLFNIFKNATGNKFEVVQINGITEGAACTVLTATQLINNDDELLIANSDQYIGTDINDFVKFAQEKNADGCVLTFESTHPKWSYARINEAEEIIEIAEKKVISSHATVGIYYYKKGSDFVKAAQSMIHKDIKHNNEFYVAPAYNEMILSGQKIYIKDIPTEKMYGLGTPEDLSSFLVKAEKENFKL